MCIPSEEAPVSISSEIPPPTASIDHHSSDSDPESYLSEVQDHVSQQWHPSRVGKT
jgi:hypothetical protein